MHVVQPSFGERPSQKYIRCAFLYLPPKIHTAVDPPFPIPQPHSPSGAQNPTMGNWPKGAHLGGAFCTPHFGPMGKWPLRGPILGGAILEPPILGPSEVTCPFFSFRPLSISRPRGPPIHLPIPNLSLANPLTHLGADLNWTRSLASPSPTLGATYGSTLRWPNLWFASHTHHLHWGNRSPTQEWNLTSNVTPTPWS